MATFPSYDGTVLAYHEKGDGPPLVCVPGGPARASEYLGDLGGLSAHRRLVLLDNRGTGDSAVPADPATYRSDRLVDDVEALRAALGLETFDLLGHSASGAVALRYAARFPHRLRRLVLVAPGLAEVGLAATDDEQGAVIGSRAGEPWFPEALAALRTWLGGEDSPALTLARSPFFYGRWDERAAAHVASGERQRNPEAAELFSAEGAHTPAETVPALAKVEAPVLVLAGALDPSPVVRIAGEAADLFPNGRLVVLPGGGHFPWLDDEAAFVRAVEDFLAE
ncbi:alpha/beta hydrolase [Longispora sp. NPDC051575]|uniref:alpha/beta fold hydrolase n=1 Tax=Longispora sp. NPDC051575 TaxID=3154943 RepID=UPI003415FABC